MRVKLKIEYDGTPFVGWQKQNNGISVQGVLENALKTALREEIILFGSGRTDAGVHAFGQIAHFDTDGIIDCFRLRESLNALIRPYPISVHTVERVSDQFHARFDAKERTYLYRILNTVNPPALEQNRVWWFKYPLDVEKMNETAQILIGKHDFSTFRASECQAKSPIKTLNEIKIFSSSIGHVDMIVKARSFLHHQVRNIMGTLVQVGCGKWTTDDFKKAFESCDRRAGGPTAPAQGLYFIHVEY